MVHFTKDSIIITVKSIESPFQDWQKINKTLSELLMLIMNNEDFPVNDYETFWFIELKSALSELDVSYEQAKQIEKLLAVA